MILSTIFISILAAYATYSRYLIGRHASSIERLEKKAAYLEKERDYLSKCFDEMSKELRDNKAGKVYLKTHSKYEEDYYGPTSYGS